MENELLKELAKLAKQTEGDDEKKKNVLLRQLQRYSILAVLDSFVNLALEYSKRVGGEKIVISVEQRDALLSLFRVKNPDETRGRKKSR